MTFRYSRHTSDLQRIVKFYTEIVGLERLGGFENHDDYDGLFLRLPGQSWHLEFTSSKSKPNNKFDDDDILVFYLNSETELLGVGSRIEKGKILLEEPKNPYWNKNGIMISDPDGFKIIFTVKQPVK